MHDGMKNSLSVDATPPVFLDAQRNGDMSLGPLFTSYSVYAGEAIAIDEISSDKAIPVYGSNGIRGYSDSANFFEDQVLVGRQGSVGTVHFAKAPFWASEHALIVKPRRDGSDKRWLKYVLEAADLQRLSRSVAQPGINATSVGFQRIPNIPSCEQSRIADYLDRETAEIDAAVADLDKYVELLRVKLEITGQKIVADLLDDHPLTQVKFLVDITTGSGDTQDAKVEGEFPFYVRSDALQWSSEYEFDCDAVLTSGDGAGVGKIFHLASGKFKAHQRVYVMHNFRKVSPTYFYWVFRTTFPNAIRYGGAKSTVDSVRMPMIANLRIPVPAPRIQEKICEQFAELEQEITQLITDATKLRDLLIKRRSVLITEVVTGRKQV